MIRKPRHKDEVGGGGRRRYKRTKKRERTKVEKEGERRDREASPG
jgi:hypothetical protein